MALKPVSAASHSSMSPPWSWASTSCSATMSASISRSTPRMRGGSQRRSCPIARCTLYDTSRNRAMESGGGGAAQHALAEKGEDADDQHGGRDEPRVDARGLLEGGGELVAQDRRREHARHDAHERAEDKVPQRHAQRAHRE